MKTPALFLLEQGHWDEVYGPFERKRLEALVPTPFIFHSPKSIFEKPEDLAKATVIFSGWGMPLCNEAFLEAAPRLKAIFFAAGSVRPFVTDAFWERGIVVSSVNTALAVSVAEFALAQILLSLKLAWRQATDMRVMKRPVRRTVPGIYGSVVGLISVGAVARHLISLLRSFKLNIVAYDPFLSKETARTLGIELVSLEELFEISHVVSLHTPWLPETEGMICGHHFARMRKNGTFINTARGAVVNENEMIEVLRRRPDLYALLDVTYPEPPSPESPLFALPNVILTPHIAGPINGECRRLGAMAVDEFERYLKGEPLFGEVREEMLATIA
jgi:phosphoglycerate dehydrogenase-like enzyme